MRIPFYDFNHILYLASQDRLSEDGKRVIREMSVAEPEITIYFSDYVKSQIHCNVTEELFKHDRDAYVRLYRGDRAGLNVVLGYFVEDVVKFLLCNDSDVQLTLVMDFGEEHELIDSQEVASIRTRMLSVLQGNDEDAELMVWLCHNCVSGGEAESKLDNYAVAYYLENWRKTNDK